MAGLEFFLVLIILIFGLIGVGRGFLKELGVTLPLLVLLLFFTQLEALIGTERLPGLLADLIAQTGVMTLDFQGSRLALVALYTLLVVITTFASYHGETLAFQGTPPKGPLGVLLGWLVGAVNGYLVGGTVWFYLDRYGYPIQRFSWFRMELTPTAQMMIPLLPPSLLSGLILTFLVIGMVWLRVAR